MKNQIDSWLDFLDTSFSLFTVHNRTSLLHPTHTPCANTAGDLVFELNHNCHLHLTMITDQYQKHSDSPGDEGELDFLFQTIIARRDLDLPSNLWVIPMTEVEKTTNHERMLFVKSELSRAVSYLRDFFEEMYNPERPPWDDDDTPLPADIPDTDLDPIPDFGSPI